MLSNGNRLRHPAQFRAVITTGVKVRRGCLVVHQLRGPSADRLVSAAPIVGFVVGRAVGTSVVRHRVTRRLRAQVRERIKTLPAPSATVVRALPGAAEASSASLGRDLDAAFALLAAGSVIRSGSQ